MLTIRKARKAFRKTSGTIFFDTGERSGTVFLGGSGRSGTTWLEEMINYDNSFRTMFEPFHSLKVDILKGWNYRQYLRPENTDPQFIEPAARILSGSIHNPWVDQYNRKHLVHKRLIKDIRANLILKWIHVNFPGIHLVFLLRHPCAVAHSKIKLGWDTHLNDFLNQDDLVTDFLEPFRDDISSAKEVFDKHIFMWCIENFVPLTQFKKNEMHILFYENLCLNPKKEIEALFPFIGQDFSPKVAKVIGKASSESRQDSAINSGENLVSSWRKNIDDRQIKRAVDILGLFGLDRVYDSSDHPLISGQDALSLFSSSKQGSP